MATAAFQLTKGQCAVLRICKTSELHFTVAQTPDIITNHMFKRVESKQAFLHQTTGDMAAQRGATYHSDVAPQDTPRRQWRRLSY